MATISKGIVDTHLRETAFDMLGINTNEDFEKVNEQTYGIILTDKNGVQRYVRIKAVVAEIKEDMDALTYMESEQAAYKRKVEEKEENARKRAEKAKEDKEKRAAKKKKEEEEE